MYRLMIYLVLGLTLSSLVQAQAVDPLVAELDVLAHSKLSKMPAQIDVLSKMDDSRVVVVLQALLGGNLYIRKTDKRLFLAYPGDDNTLELSDPLGELTPTVAPKKQFKRLAVNNRMRSQLRFAVAEINLQSADAEQRQAAVLRQLHSEQLAYFTENPANAEAFLKTGESPRDESLAVAELAATAVLAKALLNYDECVTKR